MNFAFCELNEITLYLRFSVDAYGEMQERFGSVPKAFEAVTGGNVNELVDALEILSRHGELARRYLGYDPCHIYTKAELMIELQPADILKIRDCVCNALLDGVGNQENASGKVDLGLLKLNRERKVDMTLLYKAALRLGLSLKDIMTMPIGELFKLLEDKDGK